MDSDRLLDRRRDLVGGCVSGFTCKDERATAPHSPCERQHGPAVAQKHPVAIRHWQGLFDALCVHQLDVANSDDGRSRDHIAFVALIKGKFEGAGNDGAARVAFCCAGSCGDQPGNEGVVVIRVDPAPLFGFIDGNGEKIGIAAYCVLHRGYLPDIYVHERCVVGVKGGYMRLRLAMAALAIGFACTAAISRTPTEQARVDAVLKELAVIDEEREAIKANAAEIDTRENIRREEVDSLRLRFPGVVLPDDAKSAQMETGLWEYRQRRGDTVRAIVERDVQASREKSCAAYKRMESVRAEIEASEGYKKATLAERMELRRTWEAFYSDAYREIGNPCLPRQE